jgi:hypothetical protein
MIQPDNATSIGKRTSRLLRDMEGTGLYEIGGTGGQVMLISGKGGCAAISVNQVAIG